MSHWRVEDGAQPTPSGPSLRLQPTGSDAPNLHKIDKLRVVAGTRQLLGGVQAVTPEPLRPTRGTLDRGSGVYREKREKLQEVSLVDTGKHAGRSRVRYAGVSRHRLLYHYFTRDFFISVTEIHILPLVLLMCFIYIVLFFFWALIWYIQYRIQPHCWNGLTDEDGVPTGTFVKIFIFATYTQQTIGYGNYSVTGCWPPGWILVGQTITDVLLDAVTIGLLYSRISHPRQRSRSIFISDSACISRRDSVLKFMFRVADVRRTQVVDPKVRAYIYTWGSGRHTAEGEHIPVRVESLEVPPLNGRMLLPVIVEHTIDEKSALYGHTHDSLMALRAEIVITFDGVSEFGNNFMARQSYLPNEVYWGYQFTNIIEKPLPGSTRYRVDIRRFHDIALQASLPQLPPGQLSKLVVSRAAPTVPFPVLGENTLVLSNNAVVKRIGGRIALCFRVGDSYGYQILEAKARAYIYRWPDATPEAGGAAFLDYSAEMLDVGYESGGERLQLRLPSEVRHYIDDDSPLRNWLAPGGILQDADSEIVLVVEGYMYLTSENVMRQRTYSVFNQVRVGCRFASLLGGGGGGKMTVDWPRFNDVEEEEGPSLLGLGVEGMEVGGSVGGGGGDIYGDGDGDIYGETGGGVHAPPSGPGSQPRLPRALQQMMSIAPNRSGVAMRGYLSTPALERYNSNLMLPRRSTAQLGEAPASAPMSRVLERGSEDDMYAGEVELGSSERTSSLA